MNITVEIIVVGVGPTGATLSGLLAQRGIRVAAFDKLPDLFPLPRAIGLDHEVMRVMQELQIAERMLPYVAPYRPSEYRGVSGQLIKRLDMAPEPHLLGWAPNYVFNQPAFEREIRKRLDELPAVQTHYSAEVLSWEETSEGVQVQVRLADGEITTYFGRFLVACDGGSSRIRKSLGIELQDLEFDEHWLVVDALVNDDKLAKLPQTQVQYCEPERPSTFVVGPGNHRRWEVMLMPGDSLSEDFPESELWPLLARWIEPGDATLQRAAAYRFHGLVAKQWRKGRILLAGDSAHMTPPFMAQGMVQGIRDAQNLAWKLERVLKGNSPSELLDTYQQERRDHVVATTHVAMALARSPPRSARTPSPDCAPDSSPRIPPPPGSCSRNPWSGLRGTRAGSTTALDRRYASSPSIRSMVGTLRPCKQRYCPWVAYSCIWVTKVARIGTS